MSGNSPRRVGRQRLDSPHGHRPAITILELLVVMVIVGLLAALLLPAVARARESARRLECAHRLRQIALACQTHHDAQGRLPQGWSDTFGQPTGWGWGARLLDCLEQSSVGQDIRFDLPVDHPTHRVIRQQSLSVFRCPSDHMPETFLLMEGEEDDDAEGHEVEPVEIEPIIPLYELAAANFIGVFGRQIPDQSPPGSGEGVFIGGRSFRLEDLQQGTSNTLIVGERTGWMLPSTWVGMDLRSHEGPGRIVGGTKHPPNHPEADECEFSSRHAAGAQFAFGDGHVEMISSEISLPAYWRMSSRSFCH